MYMYIIICIYVYVYDLCLTQLYTKYLLVFNVSYSFRQSYKFNTLNLKCN